MQEKAVISASRTKDMVRCSPDLLARMVSGDEPVRFTMAPGSYRLPLHWIGSLVLWTKHPENIYANEGLRKVLEEYTTVTRGVILLNLTVTGLGGTVLEPGIPPVDSVLRATEVVLERGIVVPEAVILRYDPLICVKGGGGFVLSNISIEEFSRVVEKFSSLGIRRLKTSLVDHRYSHVPRRLSRTGLEFCLPIPEMVEEFINEMSRACSGCGVRLDICCHPETIVTGETRGCIDGALINRLLKKKRAPWRVTEKLHNTIGKQRNACMCTYSRDIGHSPGVAGCFKSEGACLYCYSQRNLSGPALTLAKAMLLPASARTRYGRQIDSEDSGENE